MAAAPLAPSTPVSRPSPGSRAVAGTLPELPPPPRPRPSAASAFVQIGHSDLSTSGMAAMTESLLPLPHQIREISSYGKRRKVTAYDGNGEGVDYSSPREDDDDAAEKFILLEPGVGAERRRAEAPFLPSALLNDNDREASAKAPSLPPTRRQSRVHLLRPRMLPFRDWESSSASSTSVSGDVHHSEGSFHLSTPPEHDRSPSSSPSDGPVGPEAREALFLPIESNDDSGEMSSRSRRLREEEEEQQQEQRPEQQQQGMAGGRGTLSSRALRPVSVSPPPATITPSPAHLVRPHPRRGRRLFPPPTSATSSSVPSSSSLSVVVAARRPPAPIPRGLFRAVT